MNLKEFNNLKEKFKNADVEGKIKMYVNTEELTDSQYKELLKQFPVDKLGALEEELNKE